MTALTGRTIIGCVVFVDIVAYSKAPVDSQIVMKNHLTNAIADSVRNIAESERMILDTGDGAAICFLGDPEDAMFVASAIIDSFSSAEANANRLLRVGINLGPIKMITDSAGRPNVVGDGINVAQRIMSFASENEILVSRSYYEVVARLHQGNEQLFRSLGVKTDKHIREHQIYSLVLQGAGNADGSVISAESETLDYAPARINDTTQRLAKLIGPIARVLVERAAKSSKSVEDFCRTIAAPIQDEVDRAAFLNAIAPDWEKLSEDMKEGEPASTDAVAHQLIDDADLREVESRLTNYIGPVAKLLVANAAKSARDVDQLYRMLAKNIDNQSSRAAFLSREKTPL